MANEKVEPVRLPSIELQHGAESAFLVMFETLVKKYVLKTLLDSCFPKSDLFIQNFEFSTRLLATGST